MREFSLKDYAELISAFKDADYSFCGVEEIESRLKDGQPFEVVRHDVDVSLRPVLDIVLILTKLKYQVSAAAVDLME